MTIKYQILQETYRVPYIYQNAKYRRFEISVPKDLRKGLGAKKLTFSFKYMQQCRVERLMEVSELIAPYYIELFAKLRSGELKFHQTYSYIESFKKEIEMLYNNDSSSLLHYVLEEILELSDLSGSFSAERAVMLAIRFVRTLKSELSMCVQLNKNGSLS